MSKTQAAFMRLCGRVNRGDAAARRQIAVSLIWGVHGHIAKTAGTRMLYACALAGDRQARVDLATSPLSLLDDAFTPPEPQMTAWLAEAARRGDRECARLLGDRCGARGDTGEQAKWYRVAAELGDDELQEYLSGA